MPDSAFTPPSVGVVTVSYRSEAVLHAFLASIPASTTGRPVVVVADNEPGGGVESAADDAGADYLPMPDNAGYGGGINAAVAALPPTIQWVLISNPDIVLGAGSIDALVHRAQTDDRIGSVGPLIMTDDHEVYPSARAVPSLRTGVGHALFAGVWPGNPWTRRYRAQTEMSTRSRDAGWLSGACLLVRRSAFDELGGFDASFFMYFEDVDLGYRLGRSGYRNVFEPAARVVHSGGHSTDGGTSPSMIAAHHRSAQLFLDRKYPGRVLAPLRFAVRIGLSLRARVVMGRARSAQRCPIPPM